MNNELKITTTLASTTDTVIGTSNYDPRDEFRKSILAELDVLLVITSQIGLQPDDCIEVNERLVKLKELLVEALG